MHTTSTSPPLMQTKRHIIYTSSLITIALLLLLCIIRWEAWFGNPPEKNYTAPSEPDRILLTMAPSQPENWRRISWRCDSTLTTAHIELIHTNTKDTTFLPAKGNIVKTRSGKQAYYEATFPVHNGQYSYRVCSNNSQSSYHTFQVDLDSCTQIIVFGDLQDEQPQPFDSLLREVCKHHPKADLCVFTGDLIQRPTDEYWNIWFSSIAPIAGKIPIVACPGNHEHIKGWSRKLDPRWIATFGESDNKQKNKGHTLYQWKHIQWVTLNSDVSFHIYRLIQQKLHMTRHKWLQTTEQKWKIILAHHPFYPASIGRHCSMIKWILDKFIQKQGVHLVLNGHDHVFARHTTLQHNTQPTTPIYMVCNSSNKHYLANCAPHFERMACAHRLYTLLSITPDSMHIQTYLADTHALYDEVLCHHTKQGTKVECKTPDITEALDIPQRYLHASKEKIRHKFIKRKEKRNQSKSSCKTLTERSCPK